MNRWRAIVFMENTSRQTGALVTQVSGHRRVQHSVEMAQKVTFSKAQPENVVQMPGQTPATASG
jgi:hypothetical protein